MIAKRISAWVLSAGIGAALLSVAVIAQAPPQDRFATATVRRGISPLPNGAYRGSDMATIPRGRSLGMVTFNETEFVATSVPIQELIEEAYGVGIGSNRPRPFASIDGIPSWAERFDVEARTPGPIPAISEPQRAQRRAMLQSLLADRFQLVAHWEPRDRVVYDLVREGQLGPHLRPSAECANGTCLPGCTATAPPESPGRPPEPEIVGLRSAEIRSQTCSKRGYMGGLNFGTKSHLMVGMPLRDFVGNLQLDLRRPVVDRTGLEGPYSLELRYVTDVRAGQMTLIVSAIPPNDNWRALSLALREQLGLRLEPRTAPEDVLVIDRIALPSYD